jgi:hypothetical protein
MCDEREVVDWLVFSGAEAVRVKHFLGHLQGEWEADALRIVFVYQPS